MRGPRQSPTSRRLVVYLSGVAIGFVLLGLFSARRSREALIREDEAARRATVQAPTVPPGDSAGAEP